MPQGKNTFSFIAFDSQIFMSKTVMGSRDHLVLAFSYKGLDRIRNGEPLSQNFLK